VKRRPESDSVAAELRRIGVFVTVCAISLWIFGIGLFFAVNEICSIDCISTRRAPGVSDRKFAQIKTGLEVAEVKRIIGEPLSISPKGDSETWRYTSPKEPIDEMGMWNARYLVVSNGKVVDVSSHKVMNH